jgi:bis(5'-nucleosyl)-tetraphosphatase (symmetrical)
MRRVIVGDIQGCGDPLDTLLAKLKLGSTDLLYCAGDLVNRGPQSLAVLRRLRDLKARVVLGNHDLKLLRIASGRAQPTAGDCFEDVLDAPDSDVLLAWLGRQPVLRVERDFVLVHAGLHPQWTDIESAAAETNAAIDRHVRGSADRGIEFATEVRYCDRRGRRPERDHPPPEPPFQPWDHFYRGERTVVFGHWARRGLVVRPRLRGLDTGCVYGGSLSAWIVEEDRIVQVPGWRSS